MPDKARQEEELNTQRRARILGMNYVDTSRIANKAIDKNLISLQDIVNYKVIPITFDQHNILFGITNNTSQQTIARVRATYNDQKVAFALISDTGFREFYYLYNPPKPVVYHDIEINRSDVKTEISSVSQVIKQVKADDVLAYLVQQAHRLNASDIHIESQVESVRIRFRIDGVLHPVATLDMDKYRVLIAAIASAGNITTASDQAQQGHISQTVSMADGSQVNVNVRLETTPTINGIDVVMRLFNMNKDMFTLDRLGLSPNERRVLDDIIKKPSGLVLVVGPTGSGKTTTIYSILNSLNNPERKIITVEDPVEYQYPGITQISITSQSSHDTSFAEKLRAVLRLDPDIVMVGEIRDNDTARTALQASLTGHLVLSTFHAGSAAAALTRLLDIIGENPLFISSIRLVMAQRLVRKLDDSIKQPIQLNDQYKAVVKSIIDTLPANVPKPDLATAQFYGPGSSENDPFGYHGQVAIREQFVMTGEILKLLQSTKLSSTEEIEQSAIRSGMLTMKQNGILKAIAGETTLDEIFRVLG